MKYALVLACCAACGRLGFDAQPRGDAGGGDDGAGLDVPADVVAVRVVGRAQTAGSGQPEAGVRVVFDTGGQLTTVVSGADGVAALSVGGPTNAHVLRVIDGTPPGKLAVSSFFGLSGGMIVASGGDSVSEIQDHLTLTVPAISGATYRVSGPERCIVEGGGNAPTFQVAFETECGGETIDLYAFAESNAGDQWLRTSVTLLPNATLTLANAWMPVVNRQVTYTHVPDGVIVAALLYSAAHGERIELGSGNAIASGGSATPTAETGSDQPDFVMSELGTGETLPIAVVWDAFPPPGPIDAAHIPPPLTATLQLDPPRVTWQPGAAAFDVTLAGVNLVRPDGATVTWTAFAPRDFGSIALPPGLPADIAAPAGTTASTGAAIGLIAVGMPYAAAVAVIEPATAHIPASPLFGPGALFVFGPLGP